MSGTTELQRKMDYVAKLESAIYAIGIARGMSDDHELALLEDLDSAINHAVELMRLERIRHKDREKTSPPGGAG